jgi:hypothetical protein
MGSPIQFRQQCRITRMANYRFTESSFAKFCFSEFRSTDFRLAQLPLRRI